MPDTVNEWGWSPEILQIVISGIVGVLTFCALVVIFRGMKVASKEAEQRTRPWVGIVGCKYQKDKPRAGWDRVVVEYQNVGTLPAEDATVSVFVAPEEDPEDPTLPKSFSLELRIGAIFPQEPSNQNIDAIELWSWRVVAG